MKQSAKKVKINSKELLIYTGVLLLLLLSFLELKVYSNKKDVLGASTESVENVNPSPSDKQFWENFVAKNPNYIPGWIELGRIDKVREIDPNYNLDFSN